ncbi:hypothetical protein CQ062_01870 [Ochrobactrum sp. MYb68]|nr:hypothetical protein CQ062_01870 [Ochrobactrum sp. MYb68]
MNRRHADFQSSTILEKTDCCENNSVKLETENQALSNSLSNRIDDLVDGLFLGFSDENDGVRADFESVIDRLQERLEDALATFRCSIAEFDQTGVLEAVAALDAEIGDVISLARQEGCF